MMTAAIVLAAGKSERMGQNKLLLRLNDDTVLETILNALGAAGINRIVVVLGHKPEEIIEVLKPRKGEITIVINENYELGMTSSFQKGLRQVLFVDAAFLVLGDQPLLDHTYLNTIIRKMENNLHKTLIVSPIHGGKKGHPLLFNRQLFSEILGLKKDETIRDVVRRHSEEIVAVEAPDWTTMDMDTPEDFAHFRRTMKACNHHP